MKNNYLNVSQGRYNRSQNNGSFEEKSHNETCESFNLSHSHLLTTCDN